MVDGENIGNWGDKTNTNLRGIEEAICQTNDVTFAGTATVTLSITDFSDPPQSGRGFRLNLTGTGTAGQILQVPDIQKSYIVNNGLSVDTIIKNSTATPTVTIPAGKSAFVYSISSAGVTNAINTLTTANVVGTFEISSNASVGGTLNIGGVTTSGNISADGSLNVSSNVSAGGTLTVTGDSDVTNLSANGTFDVSGNASVGGTLAVTGDSDVSNLSASGTLDVAGETSLGDVSADGTLDVSGNGSVGGTLNVEGDLKNTSGNLTVDPATQIVEVKGDGSSVEGQVKLNCHANTHGQTIKAQPHSEGVTNTMLLPKGSNSTLVSEVATQTLTNKTLGDTSVDGTFNISGNASVGGTLAVTGDADVTNVSANGTLDVSGNASVGGTLAVTNTITGSSTVSDQDGNLRDIPLSTKVSGNYTLAIGDAGNQVTVNSANVTITVPTSVFAVGDIVSIISVNGCTATLACTAVNAVKAGDLEATALHTLDANGVASIMFSYTADLAVLTGNIS